MRIYLLSNSGNWLLGAPLSWRFSRTDGEDCEEATATLPYEPERLPEFDYGSFVVFMEGSSPVFSGLLDGFSAVVGDEGQMMTLHLRGIQALLMDNELRAQHFEVLDVYTAAQQFCWANNVELVDWVDMPSVENFYVESGQTAWEAVRGFCRQSMNVRPRFSTNGRLHLLPPEPQHHTIDSQSTLLRSEYRQNRKGIISFQTIMAYQEDGSQQVVEEAAHTPQTYQSWLSARVTLQQGDNLKASWRTAAQRVEDAGRRCREMVLLLKDAYWAEPGDIFTVDLPQFPTPGSFTLQKITHIVDASGRHTELVLEAPI